MEEPTGADLTPESAPDQSEASLASRLDELASRISLEDEPSEPQVDPLGANFDWEASSESTGKIPVVSDSDPQPVEPPAVEKSSGDTPDGLSSSLDDLRSSVEERMAVLEDSLQSVCERIESLARDGISVTGEGIEKLAESVRALEARLAGMPVSTAEGVPAQVDVTAMAHEVTRAVTNELNATMGNAFTDLASAVGNSLREHTEAVGAALEQTRSAVSSTAPGEHAAVVSGVGSEEFTTALEQIAARIGENQELIGLLANGIGESLRAHAEHLTGSLDETRSAVETAVASALHAASLTAADGPALGSLEAPLTRAEMAEALGEIAVRLLEGQEVIADRVDFVQGHLVNDAATRDNQHTSLAQALVAMSTASADADEVIVGEAMRTTESLDAVFAEMQAQRGLLAAVVDEVRRSIQTVDGAFGSVAGALVGYLAERDRLLELERADVQREMLVGFASGLKTADRKRAVTRISSALDQRADSRDAQRWRDAIDDPIPPAAPDADDVATLHDLLDRFESGEVIDPAHGASDPLLAALEELPLSNTQKPPARKVASKSVAKKAPAKRVTKAASKASAKKSAAKRTGA